MLAGIALVSSAAWADGSGEHPVARWLADRARSYGLTVGANPTLGDVRTMLVWFEAAARIDPSLADAQRGRHDLLLVLGRTDEAFDALSQYCATNPADHTRRLSLLAGQFERLQTAEQRVQFAQLELAKPNLPAPIAGELHRYLADTYRGIGDMDLAEKHARTAAETYPFDFAARQLVMDLHDGPIPPHERVAYLLASVSADPSNWRTMWTLAKLLDDLSLHRQAMEWYGRALAPDGLALLLGMEVPPSAREIAMDAYRSLRDSGERPYGDGSRIGELFPDSLDGTLLALDLIRASGADEAADELVSKLRTRLAASEQRVRKERDASGAADIAWFHLDVEPDVTKALEFSELAFGIAPDKPRVRRIYGLALAAAERWEDARTVLGPIAVAVKPDQYAAWGLARALIALDDKESALAVLRDAEVVRRSGPAYKRIVELLGQLGAAPLPMPDHSRVLSALASFDPQVLEFPDHPERFLQLSAAPLESASRFGQPWRCRIRLTNTGSFPVTIGQGQMVAGNLLLSAHADLPKSEPLVGFLPLPFADRPVLEPGRSMELVTTLDVGPLADVARSMPQRDLTVTISGILDPVRADDGSWKSALGDAMIATTRVTRRRMEYTSEGVAQLSRSIRSHDLRLRMEGLRTVAALLDERVLAMQGRLDYTPARIDRNGLETVLTTTLTDPDPYVRAWSADCWADLPFGDEQAQAIAPLLSDKHWLVRLLAVDVLAGKQGEVFKPVAERLAQADPDPLVRELATLHLDRMEAMTADKR